MLLQFFIGIRCFQLSTTHGVNSIGHLRLKQRVGPNESGQVDFAKMRQLHVIRGGQLHVIEAAAVHTVLGSLLALSKQKSLTPAGLAHSTALGFGLWSFLGPRGWAVCAAYLLLGSLVTKVKQMEKEVGVKSLLHNLSRLILSTWAVVGRAETGHRGEAGRGQGT